MQIDSHAKRKRVGPLLRGYLWLVVVAFVITGLFLSIRAVLDMRLQNAEEAWPSTEATISAASVRTSKSKSGVRWSPLWAYTYVVDGRPYTSNSAALANGSDANWYDDRAAAEQEAASRGIGAHVKAYYDPAAPERSVLDRRTSNAIAWMMLIVSLGIFAVAAWIGWLLRTAPAFTGRERTASVPTTH